jgi:hypothetical protein
MGVQVHRFSFPWEKSGWQFRPLAIHKSLQQVRSELRDQFSGVHGFNPRGSFFQTRVLETTGCDPVVSLDFEPGTTRVDRFRGRDQRNILSSRMHFAQQCSQALGCGAVDLDPGFLKNYFDRSSGKSRVVISPGASNTTRIWPADRWIRLVDQLLAQNIFVTVITHESSNVPDDQWPAGVHLFSGGIEELTVALSEARTIVSTDSFTAHLGAAVGAVPVTLFGPQVPQLWMAPGAVAVYTENIPCRPCAQQMHLCSLNHRCMDTITVEKVLEAVMDLMNER